MEKNYSSRVKMIQSQRTQLYGLLQRFGKSSRPGHLLGNVMHWLQWLILLLLMINVQNI